MTNGLTRRAFFGSVPVVLGSVVSPSARAQDHGRVAPPSPIPDIKLLRHDGSAATLPELVRGRAAAIQVMFTSCTTTCPIQAAIFARVQKLIPDQVQRGILLLSLSVDPDHDRPAALAAWLRRFRARPGWIAAAPGRADLERLRDFSGRGRNPADDHSTQVQITDRATRLVWRTSELPEAEEIAGILRKV